MSPLVLAVLCAAIGFFGGLVAAALLRTNDPRR